MKARPQLVVVAGEDLVKEAVLWRVVVAVVSGARCNGSDATCSGYRHIVIYFKLVLYSFTLRSYLLQLKINVNSFVSQI